jgi:adenine-specific DNA-methyltransferase
VTPKTWWPASEVGSNQDAKRDHLRKLFPHAKPFDTPKPEWLIQRIIEIATNPGELVLDCFLGSGTTAAVAHKMNRKWIGIERSSDVVAEYCVPRMKLVVDGQEPLGISDAVGWTGGGGFRTLRVAPSMFTVEDDTVFLDDWATNGRLAEVTAAQLGFSYEPDPPYSGRKGRSRLAVIDGLVNEAVVRALVHVLDPTSKVVICGTAIDPECRTLLKQLRPGSTLRKIPASILDEYHARAGAQV